MSLANEDETDADRAKAAELMTFTHRGQHVFRWSDERITFADDDPYYAEGVNAIAAALADARAEADQLRDAMRALAEELELRASAKSTHPMPGYDEGYREGLSDGETYAADRVRDLADGGRR